jgi:phage portal protein BeeE
MDSIKRGVFFVDGKQELKSSLLWDDATDAWKYYSNAPHAVVSGLYRTIPTLYRGISIIENECQNVPFAVFNKSGEEVDNTQDWQNTVGFLPNPRRVIGTVSQSLDRHGQAYLLKEQNRAGIVKSLKWMAASNIEPIFQPETGELMRFDRSVGSRTISLQTKDVLYFWLVDSDVEQAPPESWPLRAALQAAGVLHHLDEFMNAYFKSGAIRPMMIMAKGMPAEEERQRMETWFQQRLMALKNAFKVRVFNADTIEAKQIGDGLDQLQNQELTADQRQDVAMALGIPQAILFANSANYATAQSDKKNFYDMTVVPRCELIAEILNDQILTVMGYTIWPSPESLDIYKEDEQARSSSLQQITSAGVPLLMAMDILGYDLTKEQRADLEEAEAKKEEQAEQMAEQLQQQPEEEKPQEEEKPAPFQKKSLDDPDALAELKRWRRSCHEALRKGKPLPVDWIPEYVPAERAAQIADMLKTATDGDGIKAAFERDEAIPLPEEWPGLAEQLKRAVDLLEAVSAD